MNRPPRVQVAFPPFHIPADVDLLYRDGEVVSLEPRAVQLLRFLAVHRGRVVTKQELLDEVWHDTFTTDGVLKTAVRLARRALGDDASSPRFIATYHGRGYRFIGETDEEARAAPSLPHAVTPFVGREREVKEVKRYIGMSRLVTLTGAGGVGKTRLALALASDVRDAFPDGVWFVELAALSDTTHVTAAVATVLGLKAADDGALARALEGKTALLVLDNCEHVLGGCAALVGMLLRRCSNLRILATSREVLRVAGEAVAPVPGLAIPDAVRLFAARATAANPAFELGDGAAVEEICRRLDGLALAIELAASRARALTPAQILDRLDAMLTLLTGGDRAAQPRQQTLRAALDWSYELLIDEERALLRALSVFAGGWTIDDVFDVAGNDECGMMNDEYQKPNQTGWPPSSIHHSSFIIHHSDIEDVFTRLVDRSLVDPQGGRYRLLEAVRHYAAEKLRDEGEEEAVRGRHFAWCLALAEGTAPGLAGPEPASPYARLAAEQENVRAALGWGLGHAGHEEETLRLATAVTIFWSLSGRSKEGSAWIAAALDRATTAPVGLRARALYDLGTLAFVRLDFDRARAAFDEALALYRSLADRTGELRALNGLGQYFHETGDYESAGEVFAERKRLASELGDGLAVAMSEFCLGCIAMERGDLETAERRFDWSRSAFREQRNVRLSAMTLGTLAELAVRTRDLDRADRLLDRCEEEAGRLGDGRLTSHARRIRGGVALARGEYARALELYREVLGREREAGSRRIVIAAVEGTAAALAGLGRSGEALRRAGSAAALRDALHWPLTPSDRCAIEPLLARATEAIGVDAARSALRDGRDQDFEEAVADALTKP